MTERIRNTRRERARILHDTIVLCGGDEAQGLAHDWFQHVAAMKPCPVCDEIEAALKHEARLARKAAR